MASVDPASISNSQEQKWVDQISKILNQQLAIEVETPPVSVFHVPEKIITQKPEAYEPQQIGLGPNQHFRSQLYKKMEQKKLEAVQRVLQAHKIKDFELIILAEIRKLVPVARACYDIFLQDDDDSLTWVFAIDGLFLLDLFYSYDNGTDNEKEEDELPRKKESSEYATSLQEIMMADDSSASIAELEKIKKFLENKIHPVASNPPSPKVDPKRRLLAQDIIMVENQIPLMVLKEIIKALQLSSGNSILSENNLSHSIFRSFSEIHSPLGLCLPSQVPNHVEHLLHYMYHSIVNNIPSKKSTLEDFRKINPVVLKEHTRSANLFGKIFDFIQKIPRDEIVQLYEKIVATLKTFSETKTTIPSASKLHDIAKVVFHTLPKEEGILGIKVKGKDLYLPCVTLNNDSEVILRNLIAYETLMASDNFPLTEYMGLMCGLIINANDVKLLREVNIIKGDLHDEEVAKLFKGMNSSVSSTKMNEKSKLHRTIERLNKVYESRPSAAISLLLQKLAYWLLVVLSAIGGFVGATWKIVAFIISVGSVFLLTLQAYCEVYGCNKTKITLFPYAAS